MEEKIKVFLFSDGADYENIVFTDISGIAAWIEADVETMDIDEEREYVITIAYMTQTEIDNTPEMD